MDKDSQRKRELSRERKKRWLARQSEEKLSKIREREAKRIAERRSNLSDEERLIQRRKDAQRMALARLRETDEERFKRRQKDAQRIALGRLKTSDERSKRSGLAGKRISLAQLNATDEERSRRRQKDDQRIALVLLNTTAERRASSQCRQSQRGRHSRRNKNVVAASKPSGIFNVERQSQKPDSSAIKSAQEETMPNKHIGSNVNPEPEDEVLYGFEKDLNPETILGAIDVNEEVYFIMKWKDSDIADLVPAKVANIKCPMVVISYYEKLVHWSNEFL